MTDDDAKALREAAEAVVAADYGVSCGPYDDACEAFNLAASPAAVLRLLAEREALRAAHDTVLADLCARTDERDALRAEVEAYRDAAKYDVLMEGPRFSHWNRSQLDRARRISEAALDTAP